MIMTVDDEHTRPSVGRRPFDSLMAIRACCRCDHDGFTRREVSASHDDSMVALDRCHRFLLCLDLRLAASWFLTITCRWTSLGTSSERLQPPRHGVLTDRKILSIDLSVHDEPLV